MTATGYLSLSPVTEEEGDRWREGGVAEGVEVTEERFMYRPTTRGLAPSLNDCMLRVEGEEEEVVDTDDEDDPLLSDPSDTLSLSSLITLTFSPSP
jgi:hypothetical protein